VLYLKIENPGVAPEEAFTLFGATSKRHCTHPLMIGTFGSGNKHSTCVLLRKHINPTIFCGLLRLSFSTKPVEFKGVGGKVSNQRQVVVKFGGKDAEGVNRSREQELSVTLDYGTSDWHEMALALREYVSNALDACFELAAGALEDNCTETALIAQVKSAVSQVKVALVDERQVRAKDGFTRVFVPVTPEVQEWYNEHHKWFLHFSEPESVVRRILPKANRNRPLSDGSVPQRAVIYRRGVRVREFTASKLPSLFDYNMDLRLNESRTVDDWNIKYECGKTLAAADKNTLAEVFKATAQGAEYWELNLDAYGLAPGYDDDQTAILARRATWEAALELACGDDAVLVNTEAETTAAILEKKGHEPIKVKEGWIEAAKKLGVAKTDDKVVSEDDKKGRRFGPATVPVQEALDFVWGALLSLGLTQNKGKPPCGCFFEPINAGGRAAGLYKDGTVWVHEEHAGGHSTWMLVCVIEEVSHHITGATDYSRDFQTFLVQTIAALLPLAKDKLPL
jgi:hypothetical protein